ncbi:unnamed protein product [Orchesella dallaii]|uniref:O-acyltransferase WSD1 C-terminal domain-containing protein n=1 Tax=Orchesella dallaii TaxID=48710 RepID=A0ABP1QJ75_9HEXA
MLNSGVTMGLLRSIVWIPLRFILLLLFSPIVTVGYWALVLVVAIPSKIFRQLVSFVARQHDRDLGNLVTPKGVLAGRDFADWTTAPSHSITVVLKLRGKCDIQTLQKQILHTWVHKRNKENAFLEYPELQQYCTLRLGYLFFKWDRKFDIANHVKLYKSEDIHEETVVNDEKLHSIWEKVTKRGYNPKTSPWEFILIENYDPHGKVCSVDKLEQIPDEERSCAWIFRAHHGISDGFSIYQLLISLTDQGLPLWEQETACEAPKHFNFLMNLQAFVYGPPTFTNNLLNGVDYLHDLHYCNNRLSGKYSTVTSSSLDVKFVKNASKLHGVSFHAVLLGAISGGIRKYLLKNNLTIPLQPIRLAMPISQPNHTTKLRNEWLAGMVDLSVEKETAKQRLLTMNERLQGLKNGSLMPFLTQAMTFVGGFPVEAARLLSTKSGTSVMYSEMRGPNIPLTLFDKRLTLYGLMYSFGLGTDDLDLQTVGVLRRPSTRQRLGKLSHIKRSANCARLCRLDYISISFNYSPWEIQGKM